MSEAVVAGVPPQVRLLEWELSAPGMPRLPAHDGSVRLFVRLHGRPVGWLRLPHTRAPMDDASLHDLLRQRLGTALDRAAVRASLEPAARGDAAPVSVVVCTRDRTSSLRRCLDALLAMQYQSYEVIVVDNAPSDTATADLVAVLRDGDAHAHRVLRHVVEPRPGLDWARNRGLAEARHAIVAYTDDDVEVDAHWLSAIGTAFTDADVQLVTGLILPAVLDTEAQVLFEDVYGGMGKGFTARTLTGGATDLHTMLGAHHLGAGANMAMRRAWLQQLGGFDTALDVGTPSHGGGDLDLFHRAMAAGGTVRYEPMAIVRHHHRRDMAALQRQLGDNGRAFGVYLLQRRATLPAHERGAVTRYVIGTWFRWMLTRFVQTLRGHERLPLRLQWAEFRGALQARAAWRETYAHDRALRQRMGGDGG